jgi:hypothetical protein
MFITVHEMPGVAVSAACKSTLAQFLMHMILVHNSQLCMRKLDNGAQQQSVECCVKVTSCKGKDPLTNSP